MNSGKSMERGQPDQSAFGFNRYSLPSGNDKWLRRRLWARPVALAEGRRDISDLEDEQGTDSVPIVEDVPILFGNRASSSITT